MKKRIVRYLKHMLSTILVLGSLAVAFGIYHGASLHYADHPLMYNIGNEGPYVFYENDSILNVNYIKGTKENGFYIDKKEYSVNSEIVVKSFFQIDSTSFDYKIDSDIKSPKTSYNDGNPIIAISDIEGGYKTFRDFLINRVIQSNYFKPYYPKEEQTIERLLTSTKTGICWYRGYFKDDLTQEEVERGLDVFNAKTVIVGHTLQSKVNKTYNGKVIGIDVHHPKDYHKNWPSGKSEGLFIENDTYYRVFADGKMLEL